MAPRRVSARRPARCRSGHTRTGTPGSAAREQHRLIAGVGDVAEDALAVGHDRDAGARLLAGVAAAQDRGPFAVFEQQAGDAGDAGVLPVPPTRRLPMLMTGRARCSVREELPAYQRRRQVAAAPYTALSASTITEPVGRDGPRRPERAAARRSPPSSCPWRRGSLRPGRVPPHRGWRGAQDR